MSRLLVERLLLLLLPAACGGRPPELLPADVELQAEIRASVAAARAQLERSPSDPEAWAVLGMTYEGGDVYSQARRCYRRSVELREDPRRLYRLALVSFRMGEVDEALQAMARTIELEPGYAPARWRLGGFLEDLGRSEEALAAYQEAVRLDAGFLGAWTGMARLFLERGELDTAIELLERLRGSNPKHAQVLRLLRSAYFRAGREAEASAIEVAWHAGSFPGRDPWQAEFRPYQARPLIERAREELEAGRPAAALELLQPFIVGEGAQDWNAHAYLAHALLALGRVEEAEQVLAAALERDPDNALVLRQRARLEERRGEVDRARSTLERVRALDPGNPEVAQALQRLGPGGGR